LYDEVAKKVIEIKRKSIVPVYGTAAVWALYCLVFPLYRTWHFIVLACLGVVAYILLSKLFPGKIERIEVPKEPQRTGDDKIDALLAEGEMAVAEMRRIRGTIPDKSVQAKIDELVDITDKIFKKQLVEPIVYNQVKRFADFFLPTSIKLLNAYDRFGQSGVAGENITSTMERIDTALDTTLNSYKKFFDSLFENQALDIETDISVLETMLKRDGLLGDGLSGER